MALGPLSGCPEYYTLSDWVKGSKAVERRLLSSQAREKQEKRRHLEVSEDWLYRKDDVCDLVQNATIKQSYPTGWRWKGRSALEGE